MTEEEIRVRSVYLFLACSQAVEQFKDRLAATFVAPSSSSTLMLHKSLRKELGILFRYWTTRRIWERLEAHEEDARRLNLALLRLFTNAFQLPRDGTGLRYAELSTLAEEVQELSHRITNVLGMTHQPLLAELQGGILMWRDSVYRYTADALVLPIDELSAKVKEWADQLPPAGGTGA